MVVPPYHKLCTPAVEITQKSIELTKHVHALHIIPMPCSVDTLNGGGASAAGEECMVFSEKLSSTVGGSPTES